MSTSALPAFSIADIETLFERHGDQVYDGSRREPVTARQHALQCAQLAEWALADDTLVAAALLHDIGHFIAADASHHLAHLHDTTDDHHELMALPQLATCFGPDVLEPIRLHVAAKRYLVATDPAYLLSLSSASVHSLALQGGAMAPDEVNAFEAVPHAMHAVQLRRWDDLAKVPGHTTPPLEYYLALLGDLQRAQAARGRIEIGPQTVS